MKPWFLFLMTFTLCGTVLEAKETQTIVYNAPISKDDKIGPEWHLSPTSDCKPIITASPKGGRFFLGQIPVGKQSLKLSKLPSHSHIRVQFDLIIRGTWDGNHKEWGPDSWKFDIDGREPLINATFCTQDANQQQTFPDFAGDDYTPNKSFTAARESATLGYLWDDQRGKGKVSTDAVYKMDYLIPHTGNTIQLSFQSTFEDSVPESNKDQWYGLDNIKITTVNNPKQLSNQEIKLNLNALAGNNALVRHRARLNLLSSDSSFTKYLVSALKENKNTDIAPLIKKLNDESYEIREVTTHQLLTLYKDHHESIRQAFDTAVAPETKLRLQYILKTGRKNSHSIHQTEIARLLRIIGTPKAKKLLQTKSMQLK